MHEEIIVFTPYTQRQVQAFQRYHMRGKRWMILLVSAGVLPTVLLRLYRQLSAGIADPLYLFISIVVVFVLLMYLLSFSGVFYTSRHHEAGIGPLRAGVQFTFGPDSYQVLTKLDGKSATIRYDQVLRALETRHMFYLYTGPNAANLVDKQGFRQGTEAELRQLLQRSLFQKK